MLLDAGAVIGANAVAASATASATATSNGIASALLLRDRTPWGVSAMIVGGARIRADMRLRSKQQRRVMNAEFPNGICLA